MSTTNGTESHKRLVLAVCTPSTGHVVPMLQISSHLIDRGYDVWFLAHPMFRGHVERAGPKYIPALRSWNFEGLQDLYNILVGDRGPSRHERWAALYTELYKETWVRNIPSSLESVRRAMGVIRSANPHMRDQDFVIMAETWAPGLIPLRLGAELPEGYTKAPKILGISIIPPQFTSLEHGPHVYGPLNAGLSASLGLPHDRTAALPVDGAPSSGPGEAIRARNALLARLACAAMGPVWDSLRFVLRMCGASDDIYGILAAEVHMMPQLPSNLSFLGTDTTLQMCVPGLEYDDITWPRHVRFGGTLPPRPLDPGFEMPGWLRERLGAKTTIVFATQGTIALDYRQVIVPTVKALAGREDFTVVATLGRRGASLDDYFPEGLPANAVVLDYFPYTPILEKADLVITNGSYGIYSQCATFGVPMLLVGAYSEDKPEVCNRAEYSGIGLYLRNPMPSPEVVREGVDSILSTDRYKKRAAMLKAEVAAFPCLDIVQKELLALY